MNNSTYYKLGIIGVKSTLNRRKNLTPKYRVEICLDKPYFKPGKKNYQRTYECLKRLQLKCDFIIKWQPKESKHSPNSLENYFTFLKNNSTDDELLKRITIHRCIPKLRTFTNRQVPLISINNEPSDETVENFIDWIGAQLAEIKFDNVDEEISSFSFEDHDGRSNVHCAELKGFFISADVEKLWLSLKDILEDDQPNAMIMHGFEDGPQCWTGRNNEHYKNVSGENLYGIAKIKDKTTITWCITDEYDFGIEKL